eukprot:TRINITY_DN8451_c0_g1_i3.p1 TRINITY_DN8451_c0_g1~~TRINITY_DN8451_c0_g1_i3.p1  ORF type:complete len:747 (-),score=79.68 TRINITY_DN8451_c0_g1_i3:163-2343(-)
MVGSLLDLFDQAGVSKVWDASVVAGFAAADLVTTEGAACLPYFATLHAGYEASSSLAAAEESGSTVRCIGTPAGRFCVGQRSLKYRCEYLAYCRHEHSDHLSITGLLGQVEQDSGTVQQVVNLALWLAIAVVMLAWLYFMSAAAITGALPLKRQCRRTRFSIQNDIGQSLSNVLQRMKRWCFTDPFEGMPANMRKHAQELLERQRIARFRRAGKWIFIALPMFAFSEWRRHYLALPFTMHLQQAFCYEEEWRLEACRLWEIRGRQQFVAVSLGPTLLLLFCMVATFKPARVSRRFVSAAHVAVIFGAIVHLFDMVWMENFVTFQTSILVLVRAAFAVLDGDIKLVGTLNILLTVLQYIVLSTSSYNDVERTQLIRETFAHTVVICLLTTTLQRGRCDLVIQVLRADKKTEEAATVKNILGLMCDAVAEVVDGSIAVACPQLAGLTLRSSSSGLKDKTFVDVVHQDDRQRFQEALSGFATNCSMLHLRLVDGLGGVVPVQLFVAAQRSKYDDLQHIIGIREDVDPGMTVIPNAPDDLFPEQAPPPVPVGSRTAGPCSERQSRRSSSRGLLENLPEGRPVSDCPEAQVLVRACPLGWPELALVWIRPAENWRVVRASPSFLDAVGQSSFREAVDFRKWIQKAKATKHFVKFVKKLTACDAGSTVQNLKLLPPGAPYMVRCNLTLLFVELTEENDTDMAFLVNVTDSLQAKERSSSESSASPRSRSIDL